MINSPAPPTPDRELEFAIVTAFDRSIPTRQFQGVHYIAMRPLVEALGLAWKPQFMAIKRRHTAARVIPFRESNERYRRLLGLPLGEVHAWANSINLKKIRTEPAIQNLLAYRAELDLEADGRSRMAIIEARVARLGDKYRDLPLCPAETKMLDDMRKAVGTVEPFLAYLSYGHVLGLARRELDRMILVSYASSVTKSELV